MPASLWRRSGERSGGAATCLRPGDAAAQESRRAVNPAPPAEVEGCTCGRRSGDNEDKDKSGDYPGPSAETRAITSLCLVLNDLAATLSDLQAVCATRFSL